MTLSIPFCHQNKSERSSSAGGPTPLFPSLLQSTRSPSNTLIDLLTRLHPGGEKGSTNVPIHFRPWSYRFRSSGGDPHRPTSEAFNSSRRFLASAWAETNGVVLGPVEWANSRPRPFNSLRPRPCSPHIFASSASTSCFDASAFASSDLARWPSLRCFVWAAWAA